MFTLDLFPNPSICLPTNLPPLFEEAKHTTNCLQIINEFASASKKYSEIKEEHINSIRLQQQWLTNNQLPMRQMLCHPPDAKRINWNLIPSDLTHLASEISEITGWYRFPILLAVLGSLNCAMWGRYQVQPRQEWIEPVVLYLLLMAAPGKNKSLVYRLLARSIKKFQRLILDRYSKDVKAVCNLKKAMRQAKSMAQAAAIKTALKEARDEASGVNLNHFFDKVREFAEDMAVAADEEIEQLDSPVFLADGFTNKKLLRRMANSGGQAIYQSEVATFIEYLKASRFDPKIFLKSYDMEDFSDDTVPGGYRHAKKPFLPILFYGQVDIAAPLYSLDKARGSGLSARFAPLFVPAANPPSTTPEQVGCENLKQYEQKIAAMFERNFTQKKDREIFTIQLAPEARMKIELYQRELKETVLPYSTDGLESFVEKLAGTAVRIAGVLHVWQFDKPEQHALSHQTILAGIEITRAILPHARYAFSTSGFRAYGDALKILKWVKRHQQFGFTSRDIAQYSGVKTNEKIFPALDLLAQHNILTQLVTAHKPRVCLMHQGFNFNT